MMDWIVIFSFVILIHWLSWILTQDDLEKEDRVRWFSWSFVKGGKEE